MTDLINTIKEAIAWFFSTELPKETAEAVADLFKFAAAKLAVLFDEYITVIFG